MKPLSNPAFERAHTDYAMVLVTANRNWQPTGLINRRSGRIWPKAMGNRLHESLSPLLGIKVSETVWEIRIADGNDLAILRNVIGHDRVRRETQADGTAIYAFTYDRTDYANWGSVLRTF